MHTDDALTPGLPFSTLPAEAMPLLGWVRRFAYQIESWCRRNVHGYTSPSGDEFRGDCLEIAYWLATGRCPCRASACRDMHQLLYPPPPDGWTEEKMRQCTRRAVIGPAGLRANSLVQGMYYGLVLRPRGVACRNVEFRYCQSCGRRYLAVLSNQCPSCRTPFTWEETPVRSEPWLVIDAHWVAQNRWVCGPPRRTHCYPKDRERCMLRTCRHCGRPHRQRPATVYVSANLMAPAEPPPRVPADVVHELIAAAVRADPRFVDRLARAFEQSGHVAGNELLDQIGYVLDTSSVLVTKKERKLAIDALGSAFDQLSVSRPAWPPDRWPPPDWPVAEVLDRIAEKAWDKISRAFIDGDGYQRNERGRALRDRLNAIHSTAAARLNHLLLGCEMPDRTQFRQELLDVVRDNKGVREKLREFVDLPARERPGVRERAEIGGWNRDAAN
jgi:hypothetical protein